MTKRQVPPEFKHLADGAAIHWDSIFDATSKKIEKGFSHFEAFTDTVIESASKESMKKIPEPSIIKLGLEASLTRGRMTDALFLSTDTEVIAILSLRAIAQFVLSDIEDLRKIQSSIKAIVSKDSDPADQIRLSTVNVLLAAAERDTSVIMCVMEFDNMLETYPEQVEDPLTETLFTLYVVGTLLREVGQAGRASRITDTLEGMATKQENRMFLALTENLRGNICNLHGEFKEAEYHYKKMGEISEDLSFRLGLAMSYNNLGTIRANSLRLEEAIEYFEKSYAHFDVDARKKAPLVNMGEICIMLGRYQEAEKYLQEGVRLEKKTQSGTLEIYTYYSILLTKIGEGKKAADYLKTASKLAETSEQPLQKGAYLLAKGNFEIFSKDWKGAISSFEEVLKIARQNSMFELLVRSELELARTYLQLFRSVEDNAVLTKAIYHIDDLIQIAKEQELQSLYAEALILRSDIYRIAGKELEAKGDLERAHSIALFAEDGRLQAHAKQRLEVVEIPVLDPSTMDEALVNKTIDRMAGFKPAGKLKTVPRPLLRALVALGRKSGLPEFVHYFDADLEMDSSLLSGFISAITAFSSELMGDRGLLRSINHEGFTVMMEYTDHRIVTLIADKETFDIRFLLSEFTKKFDDMYPTSGIEGVVTSDYETADDLVVEFFTIPHE
ncbi:MAG: tetratricopeptide repeat protein [Candidatus Thorarchaeota archaeon]